MLKTYAAFAAYDEKFEVPVEVMQNILTEGEKQGDKPADEDEMQRTLPSLRLQVKALVARDLFDMDAYFQVINQNSDIVNKALECIDRR